MRTRSIAVFRSLLLSVSLTSVLASVELRSDEAVALESAWSSGQHHSNVRVQLRRGFGASSRTEEILTDSAGVARAASRQWERLEFHLPRAVAAAHTACLMVQAKCRPLPVGASLDKEKGILYWHVPNAYKGEFDLVFQQPGSRAAAVRVAAGSDVVTRYTVEAR